MVEHLRLLSLTPTCKRNVSVSKAPDAPYLQVHWFSVEVDVMARHTLCRLAHSLILSRG